MGLCSIYLICVGFPQLCHCILDINLASVKRLHNHHVYPIVLLIKFKSTKQIKEVKDTRYLSDKTTAKAAKEMYEHALKLESEYRHYISGRLRCNFHSRSCIHCVELRAI